MKLFTHKFSNAGMLNKMVQHPEGLTFKVVAASVDDATDKKRKAKKGPKYGRHVQVNNCPIKMTKPI
jgi:hypothetical protein